MRAGSAGVERLVAEIPPATRGRTKLGFLVACALLLFSACAKSTRAPDVAATPGTPVDSATVALWRMDETGGTRAADAGPSRLDAAAGVDTRTVFGRFRGARLFSRSTNSFLYVPYSPLLDLPAALTLEAWIAPNASPRYEDTPIAARWSPQTADRSWLFCIAGSKLPTDLSEGNGPGWHREFIQNMQRGRLMFVFQPEEASAAHAFFSLRAIELQRWTHVAVTYDGQVVRFWVDGQPDGTYATSGRIRTSAAPLLVGNFFDTRLLTDFGGDLRQGPAADSVPWYAFDGAIDELRISSVARTEFPLHGGR